MHKKTFTDTELKALQDMISDWIAEGFVVDLSDEQRSVCEKLDVEIE